MTGLVIAKLDRGHATDAFDCGDASLNRFLGQHALQNQLANAAQTYVCVEGSRIIGYATLAVGAVSHGEAPERLRKGLARFPVPVMVLARLAVDRGWQGRGVGASLLKDMALRTVQSANIAGIRALIIHAKDEAARDYYRQFGFSEGFPDPLHMYVLTKELKSLAAG